MALRRIFQRFLEQFLGLRVAAVRKENFRFGYRVDLPGRVCRRRSARVSNGSDRRCARRCFGKDPRRARFFGVGLRFTPAFDGAPHKSADDDERDNGRTKIGRLLQHLIQQAGLGDRHGCHFGGRRFRLHRRRL